MAAANAAQQQRPAWASLPSEIVSRIVAGEKALQVCSAWAHAILRSGRAQLRLRIGEDSRLNEAALRTLCTLWRNPWGSGGGEKGVALQLSSYHRALFPAVLKGWRLDCVTRLVLDQSLETDGIVPGGLEAVLPNLRELRVAHWCSPPAIAGPLHLHPQLRQLDLGRLDVQPAPFVQQLAELARLPSLASLRLASGYTRYPTSFLPLLSSQLTELQLCSSYSRLREDEEDEEQQQQQQQQQQAAAAGGAPRLTWEAILREHVAPCTRLQSLSLPCGAPEDLRVLGAALLQLRRLHICESTWGSDGDAVMDALLAPEHFPQLTSLRWDGCFMQMQRSHAERPCRWQQLALGLVGPQQLARLPLHSLRRTTWARLRIKDDTRLADVRLAVANVRRVAGPCGVAADRVWANRLEWEAHLPSQLELEEQERSAADAGEDATARSAPAAVMSALGPLLAPAEPGAPPYLLAIHVEEEWGRPATRALLRAIPHSYTRIKLCGEMWDALNWVDVGAHLTWVEELSICGFDSISVRVVWALLCAHAGALSAAGGRAGASPLRRLRVECRAYEHSAEELEELEGMSEQARRDLGLQVEVSIKWTDMRVYFE